MELTKGPQESNPELPDVSDPRLSQKEIREFVKPFFKGERRGRAHSETEDRAPDISHAFIDLLCSSRDFGNVNKLLIEMDFAHRKDSAREVMKRLYQDYLGKEYSQDIGLADYYFDPAVQVLGAVRDAIMKMPQSDRAVLDKKFKEIGPTRAGKRIMGYITDYLGAQR